VLTRLSGRKGREMTCVEFRKMVSRYADGELPGAFLTPMRQHANECPACRLRLQEIHRLSAVLAAYAMPEVPTGFAEAVMRRARAEGIAHRAPILWFHPVWWDAMTRPARVAAAALLMVSMGLGGFMAWDTGQAGSASAGRARQDPVTQYALDVFKEAPAGSLPQVYLALAE
jgi:anti-sigma factor RsiW